MSVTSRQTLLAAMRCEQPDKVPIFEVLMDEPIVVAVVELLGLDAPVPASPDANLMGGEDSVEALDRYCLLVDVLGLDATSYNFSTGMQLLGNGCAVDRYGRIYRLSRLGEPTIVEGPIKEPSDLKGYDTASRLRPDDFSRMPYIVE